MNFSLELLFYPCIEIDLLGNFPLRLHLNKKQTILKTIQEKNYRYPYHKNNKDQFLNKLSFLEIDCEHLFYCNIRFYSVLRQHISFESLLIHI